MRLLLALLLLCACTPKDPGPCPTAPCDLLGDGAGWQVSGVSSSILAGLPEPSETTHLIEDFEGEGPWTFDGVGGAHEPDEAGNHRLVMTTSDGDRPTWRSAPFEVDPGRSYTMTWREALFGIGPPKRIPKLRAGVSIEYFNVPNKAADPVAWINDPKNAGRSKQPPSKSGAWRPAEGRSPWALQAHTFRGPNLANWARIVIAGGPRRRGGAPSHLEVDDLVLRSSPSPTWTARDADMWQDPGDPPLLHRARGKHPAHRHASEIRDVVLAPAPTTLARAFRVPKASRLDLGYGLSPGSRGPAVTFTATLIDSEGGRHALHSGAVQGGNVVGWRNASVDLAPWAGRSVTLELATSGREAPEDPLEAVARQPEARAVWSDARLEPTEKPGRLAVLVVIDTLGAKHASGWGGTRETTPNLQRIGAEGLFYAEARSPAPWTLPSVASYLTGLTPDEHGAGEQLGRDHYRRRPLLPEHVTLQERLRTAGWDTRAWINNKYLSSEITRLDQGFSHYTDYGIRTERGGSRVGMDAVVEELSRPAGDRFMLVHLMDPHLPYKPPKEFMSRFVDPKYKGPLIGGRSYKAVQDLWKGKLKPKKKGKKHLLDLHEAAIAFADDQVGRVYDAAKATGQELLFIVTSDHGEEFWEHGSFDHGHSLFDELMHVPLVVHQTGGKPARVSSPVSAIGVHGTVLDFAGLEHQGPSLPTVDAPVPVHGRPTLYGVRQRMVEVDGWKYIVRQRHTGRRHRRVRNDPIHLLFDLANDPDEEHDRMAMEAARAHAMHRQIVEEALPGYGGAHVVQIGPGDEPVELVWTMDGGDGWSADVTDFPWPTEDGQAPAEAMLTVQRDSTDQAASITMRVTHRPTLILVEPAGKAGTIKLSLNGADVLLPTDRTAVADLLARVDAGAPEPVVLRLGGEARGAGTQSAPTDEDLEALRALGYMDD